MALRWKELQPFRAAELDALLTQITELAGPFTNSLGMSFVLVPAGTCWMGGGGGKPGTRKETIAQSYHIGAHPVTQVQWLDVMGKNPAWINTTRGGGPDHPVENVSWNDVAVFLQKLHEREQGSGLTYRLPTEVEWEHACRAGAKSKTECSYHFYLKQACNDLDSTRANFNGIAPDGGASKGPWLGRTTKVGLYPPNELGIYDMHGNVWEWCADAAGPFWAQRAVRGGCWYSPGALCRAAARWTYPPATRNCYIGVRLVAISSR
jgi:formylglycine-generating enzyme required for sulfatase activity